MPAESNDSSAAASSQRDFRHARVDSGSSTGWTSMFMNAINTRIKNSSFAIINNIQAPRDHGSDPLGKLYAQVAPNAILNAGGRADEVGCYPGTREVLVALIERWMDSSGRDGAPKMMWLSRPAGAGKSAIVQTIAERCKERGVQAASFFFFRADPTRSSARAFVATLLYQVLKFYPAARQAIEAVLSVDPLLFDASIQDQFKQLLLLPLQDVQKSIKSSARRPIVLLIDGLDECDSEHTTQKQILQVFDYALMQKECPFMVLVASRAEPHIAMAFKQLSGLVQPVFLDDQYNPHKDIHIFVTREFDKIKKSHPLGHTLGDQWPWPGDIWSIVKESSGHFVYAATIMRFIANPSVSLELSLQRVQGFSPLIENSPFARLDAMYVYILSQTDDREAMVDLLSMKLFNDFMNSDDVYIGTLPLKSTLCAYNTRYSPELLDSCVSNLAAALDFRKGELEKFHASLFDFLKDKSRAGVFYIDLDAFGIKILPTIWKMALTSRTATIYGMILFLKLREPTPDITKAFLTISPLSMSGCTGRINSFIPSEWKIFYSIHRLYYPHAFTPYRKIIRLWASWLVIHSCYPREYSESKLEHLPNAIMQIRIAQLEHWWAARTPSTVLQAM